MTEIASAFDEHSIRSAMRDEAQEFFDRGLAKARRNMAAYLAKEGCECDRCDANRVHRDTFDPRSLFKGDVKTSKPRGAMSFDSIFNAKKEK